jgi:hypothetical protein
MLERGEKELAQDTYNEWEIRTKTRLQLSETMSHDHCSEMRHGSETMNEYKVSQATAINSSFRDSPPLSNLKYTVIER